MEVQTQSHSRPRFLNLDAPRNLLQRDLLTPSSPVTPSSSTAADLNSPYMTQGSRGIEASSSTSPGKRTPGFRLSAPPTPTFVSSGTGVLVRMSDGTLAVRTVRKTLRIDESRDHATKECKQGEIECSPIHEGGLVNGKGKEKELTEGMEVDFQTDGTKVYNVRQRRDS